MDSGISFQWNSLFLAVSILVLILTCGLAWIACARSRFRSSIVWLELFRVLLVAVAVLLLNQPEVIYQIDPTRRPTVVILGDESLSMETADMGDELNPMRTRQDSVRHLMDKQTWAAVEQDADVVVVPFASDPENDRTDIDAALASALDGYPNLRAVVLASDGDWNAGAAPVEAATKFRMQQVPIFTIPVGSQERLPDVELLSFEVPALGVANKTLRIPFSVESSLPQDHRAIAKLVASDGTEVTREFTIQAMGQTSEAILWKPDQTGDFQLTLTIPMHASERIANNNELSMPISIPEVQLKVLVIESRPRWEYRYLRNALSRDPGIEVSCLLFHPGLTKTGGGNRDYIASFPDDLADLSQYDVVFLGDVGVSEDQLSEEQCQLLKGLVEQQASGLVVIPGIAGHVMS
ncbi:putative membrane protein, partial [Rhodopirellula maiorica SM1]